MHRLGGTQGEDEGFTLIELLVVIIIIGILAAIAIPAYLSNRQRAYEASMKSDLRNVANEETSYYTDTAVFADSSSVTFTSPNGLSRGSVLIFPDAAVTLSAFNTVSIPAAGGNGFCLKIVSSKTSKVYYYDSLGGGITRADCSGNAGY